MKCESCSGIWLVADEDLDRQRVCPYCSSSIHGEIEFTEYDSLDKAIYGAISKMGKGVIQNPRQLSGFMLDMAPMLKKEIRIFSKTITEDYVAHIKSAFDTEIDAIDATINKLHHLFVDEEGLSENWADILCAGLYGAILYSRGIGTTRIINAEVCDFQVAKETISPTPVPSKSAEATPVGRSKVESTIQEESSDDEKYDILNHYKCAICGYVIDGYDLEYGDGYECPICGAENWYETEDELSEDAPTPFVPQKPTNTYDSAPFKSAIESAEKHLANRNTDEALENYRQMANEGYVPAYISVADIYYQRKNYKKAWKWYLKAAEAGDSNGQYHVGYFYQEGLHVKKNTYLAVKYYEKAADQGLLAAIMAIAQCYETGIGYSKDVKKAIENYTSAANAGYGEAQYQLGLHYQTGNGVSKDITKAAEWYQRAYLQGHSEAKRKLDDCIAQMPLTQRLKWKFH